MSKTDVIEIEGVVVEKLPNAMFKVELENCLLYTSCTQVQRFQRAVRAENSQKTDRYHHTNTENC